MVLQLPYLLDLAPTLDTFIVSFETLSSPQSPTPSHTVSHSPSWVFLLEKLYAYKHPLPPELSCHPTRLGHHTTLSWVPCALWQLPASSLSYTWYCIYVNATLSIHPALSFLHCVHRPLLYVCVSIPSAFLLSLQTPLNVGGLSIMWWPHPIYRPDLGFLGSFLWVTPPKPSV